MLLPHGMFASLWVLSKCIWRKWTQRGKRIGKSSVLLREAQILRFNLTFTFLNFEVRKERFQFSSFVIELLYKTESKYISITFWLKLKGRNDRNPELGQASSQLVPLCIRSRRTSPSFLRLSHKLHFVCLHGNFFFSCSIFLPAKSNVLTTLSPFCFVLLTTQAKFSLLCKGKYLPKVTLQTRGERRK